MAIGNSETLKIIISAKNKADKELDRLSSKLKQTSRNMKLVGAAAVGMGVVIGKKAVDAAMAFEKSMSNVSTLLDTNTENMEKMKKEVMDMSTRVPVALEDLTASLYDVRSAGIDSAGAMEVLENAARLGVGGLGTTKEATDVLTSAINAFGIESINSAEVADTFFKAVKSGKTNISELAQGFGQIAPSANAVGVEFEELMAITAGMTTSGLKASVAYTQIRAVLTNLQKPTAEMQEAYNNLNITSIKSQVENEGLADTVRKLAAEFEGDEQAMAKAFGSAEALNAVMMLTGDTGTNVTEILNGMTNGTNALDEAVKKQNETYAAQYTLLKNQLNQQLIKLGVELLPLIKKGIEDGILIVKEWKSWFDSLADTLGTVIFKLQQAWDWLKKVNKKATDFFTGGEGGMKYVPFFQHGGTVPGAPTQAVPIIAHGGEQVIPANQTKRGAGGGVAITINNPIVRSDDDLDRITRQVEKVFRGVFLNNKVAF